MPEPKSPDADWFIVCWDEGPDDHGYALYERLSDKLRWHLDESGDIQDETYTDPRDWHPSCQFIPLNQAGVDACLAVAALSPAVWPAYAAQLFEECEHG